MHGPPQQMIAASACTGNSRAYIDRICLVFVAGDAVNCVDASFEFYSKTKIKVIFVEKLNVYCVHEDSTMMTTTTTTRTSMFDSHVLWLSSNVVCSKRCDYVFAENKAKNYYKLFYGTMFGSLCGFACVARIGRLLLYYWFLLLLALLGHKFNCLIEHRKRTHSTRTLKCNVFILVAQRLERKMSVCMYVRSTLAGFFLMGHRSLCKYSRRLSLYDGCPFLSILSANVFFITMALVYDIDSLTLRGQCERTRYRPSHEIIIIIKWVNAHM